MCFSDFGIFSLAMQGKQTQDDILDVCIFGMIGRGFASALLLRRARISEKKSAGVVAGIGSKACEPVLKLKFKKASSRT